jgi:hypothetical protein
MARGFYMTLVPTGDEMVIITGTVGEGKDEVSMEKACRIWQGYTSDGHEVEVAVIKILKIHPEAEAKLKSLLEALAKEGE